MEEKNKGKECKGYGVDVFYNIIDNRKYSCERRADYVLNRILKGK